MLVPPTSTNFIMLTESREDQEDWIAALNEAQGLSVTSTERFSKRREEGRKEGRKEGRYEGRREGMKEGGKEGTKEGRKEGKKKEGRQ